MTANTAPIFSVAPDIQAIGPIIAVASVLYNASGTIGTDVYLVYTAPTNGGFVQRVRFKYVANATTASNACVVKLFISSATSGAVTDANSWFYDEIALPATGTLTTTAGNATYDIPFGFGIPAGYTILAKITVAQPTSCGWMATAIAGHY